MTLESRIFLSLGFILGYFFFRYVGTAMNRRLQNNLTNINPGLVKKVPWYFRFMDRFFRLFAWISLLFAALLFADMI